MLYRIGCSCTELSGGLCKSGVPIRGTAVGNTNKHVHTAKIVVGQLCGLGHWPLENLQHRVALW